MVLVEGEPGAERAGASFELQSRLRESDLLVLDARALGPARRALRDEDFEAAAEAGASWVFALSMRFELGEPRFELRVVEVASGRDGELRCGLDELVMTSEAIDVRSEVGASTTRPSEEVGTHFAFGIPSRWNPRHGRGPDRRPLLRDAHSGKWIDYDEAYLRLGRPDWQAAYDRRSRGKLILFVTGTMVGVGGLSTSAVFATDSHPAYTRSRVAVLGWGLAAASVGGLMIVTSAMIDPHPVSFDEVREHVEASSRERFDLQVHAGPSGAAAGFRAAF